MHYSKCKLDKETQILMMIMGPFFSLVTFRLSAFTGAQSGLHTDCDQATHPVLTSIKIDAQLIFTLLHPEPTELPCLYLFLRN